MRKLLTGALIGLGVCAFAGPAAARDQIRIVGSSTVFPFATAVAEQFGRGGSFKTPIVESTGTGGGLKLFCAGVGAEHPDIANASRRIKQSEIDACKKNGINDIVEIKVGFDGIVIANSKQAKPFNVTKEQLFRALAKQVPVDGKLVANPYKAWSDIDPSLPKLKIEVLGPPPTSGTRDAFTELVMEGGAQGIPMLAELEKSNKDAFVAATHAIREDGAYVEAGENDNLIVQKLEANQRALGIFGYSYLDQNADKIQAAKVNGVDPSFENIASGKYSVSRPLFVYLKKAHVGVIPGLKEYLAEFTSTKAAGPEGYLADKGLIPLPDAERKRSESLASSLTPMGSLEDVAAQQR